MRTSIARIKASKEAYVPKIYRDLPSSATNSGFKKAGSRGWGDLRGATDEERQSLATGAWAGQHVVKGVGGGTAMNGGRHTRSSHSEVDMGADDEDEAKSAAKLAKVAALVSERVGGGDRDASYYSGALQQAREDGTLMETLSAEVRSDALEANVPTLALANDFFSTMARKADIELGATEEGDYTEEDGMLATPQPLTQVQRAEQKREANRSFYGQYCAMQGVIEMPSAEDLGTTDATVGGAELSERLELAMEETVKEFIRIALTSCTDAMYSTPWSLPLSRLVVRQQLESYFASGEGGMLAVNGDGEEKVVFQKGGDIDTNLPLQPVPWRDDVFLLKVPRNNTSLTPREQILLEDYAVGLIPLPHYAAVEVLAPFLGEEAAHAGLLPPPEKLAAAIESGMTPADLRRKQGLAIEAGGDNNNTHTHDNMCHNEKGQRILTLEDVLGLDGGDEGALRSVKTDSDRVVPEPSIDTTSLFVADHDNGTMGRCEDAVMDAMLMMDGCDGEQQRAIEEGDVVPETAAPAMSIADGDCGADDTMLALCAEGAAIPTDQGQVSDVSGQGAENERDNSTANHTPTIIPPPPPSGSEYLSALLDRDVENGPPMPLSRFSLEEEDANANAADAEMGTSDEESPLEALIRQHKMSAAGGAVEDGSTESIDSSVPTLLLPPQGASEGSSTLALPSFPTIASALSFVEENPLTRDMLALIDKLSAAAKEQVPEAPLSTIQWLQKATASGAVNPTSRLASIVATLAVERLLMTPRAEEEKGASPLLVDLWPHPQWGMDSGHDGLYWEAMKLFEYTRLSAEGETTTVDPAEAPTFMALHDGQFLERVCPETVALKGDVLQVSNTRALGKQKSGAEQRRKGGSPEAAVDEEWDDLLHSPHLDTIADHEGSALLGSLYGKSGGGGTSASFSHSRNMLFAPPLPNDRCLRGPSIVHAATSFKHPNVPVELIAKADVVLCVPPTTRDATRLAIDDVITSSAATVAPKSSKQSAEDADDTRLDGDDMSGALAAGGVEDTLPCNDFVRVLTHQQERCCGKQLVLLTRGLQMLKAGGMLVYATSTLDPHQNERIVATALHGMGGAVCDADGADEDMSEQPPPASNPQFRCVPAFDLVSKMIDAELNALLGKKETDGAQEEGPLPPTALQTALFEWAAVDSPREGQKGLPPSDILPLALRRHISRNCVRVNPMNERLEGMFIAVIQRGEGEGSNPVDDRQRQPAISSKGQPLLVTGKTSHCAALAERAVTVAVEDTTRKTINALAALSMSFKTEESVIASLSSDVLQTIKKMDQQRRTKPLFPPMSLLAYGTPVGVPATYSIAAVGLSARCNAMASAGGGGLPFVLPQGSPFIPTNLSGTHELYEIIKLDEEHKNAERKRKTHHHHTKGLSSAPHPPPIALPRYKHIASLPSSHLLTLLYLPSHPVNGFVTSETLRRLLLYGGRGMTAEDSSPLIGDVQKALSLRRQWALLFEGIAVELLQASKHTQFEKGKEIVLKCANIVFSMALEGALENEKHHIPESLTKPQPSASSSESVDNEGIDLTDLMGADTFYSSSDSSTTAGDAEEGDAAEEDNDASLDLHPIVYQEAAKVRVVCHVASKASNKTLETFIRDLHLYCIGKAAESYHKRKAAGTNVASITSPIEDDDSVDLAFEEGIRNLTVPFCISFGHNVPAASEIEAPRANLDEEDSDGASGVSDEEKQKAIRKRRAILAMRERFRPLAAYHARVEPSVSVVALRDAIAYCHRMVGRSYAPADLLGLYGLRRSTNAVRVDGGEAEEEHDGDGDEAYSGVDTLDTPSDSFGAMDGDMPETEADGLSHSQLPNAKVRADRQRARWAEEEATQKAKIEKKMRNMMSTLEEVDGITVGDGSGGSEDWLSATARRRRKQ